MQNILSKLFTFFISTKLERERERVCNEISKIVVHMMQSKKKLHINIYTHLSAIIFNIENKKSMIKTERAIIYIYLYNK